MRMHHVLRISLYALDLIGLRTNSVTVNEKAKFGVVKIYSNSIVTLVNVNVLSEISIKYTRICAN